MAVEINPAAYYRPNDADLRDLLATPGTLAQWRFHGTGPKYHKLADGRGSRILYLGADVLSWLEEKRVVAA